MRIKLLPYKLGSVTAKSIAQGLNIKQLFTDHRSRFRGRRSGDFIINWGSSVLPENLSVIPRSMWFNHPYAVQVTSDKLLAFRKFRNQRPDTLTMPESTEDFSVAKNWVNAGKTVYCRRSTRGHSGRGIVVARDTESLVRSPLYTLGFKATHEYRVHVMRQPRGDYAVIDRVKKGRRREVSWDDMNMDVRNHENGFIFIRDCVELPEQVLYEAKRAVQFYGLDFGAVDIGWNKTTCEAMVYEINSAPGLEGTSLQRYINALREHF